MRFMLPLFGLLANMMVHQFVCCFIWLLGGKLYFYDFKSCSSLYIQSDYSSMSS